MRRCLVLLAACCAIAVVALTAGCPPEGGPAATGNDNQNPASQGQDQSPGDGADKIDRGIGWIWYYPKMPITAADHRDRYPTFIIVHGLQDQARDDPNTWQGRMADRILQLIAEENTAQKDDPTKDVLADDVNIVFWDWGYYSLGEWDLAYSKAAPAEGQKLAQAIVGQMNDGVIDPDPSRIHLIAHSDGGYVCGTCAQSLVSSGRGRVGQLTGLDVPDRLILPRTVTISPELFGAVSWYFLRDDSLIKSLALTGANVLREQAPDWEGVTHKNIPDWYTDHRIVRDPDNRQWWDSWVAVKDSPPLVPARYVLRRTLDVSYSLRCQGFHFEEDRLVMDDPVSESDAKHFASMAGDTYGLEQMVARAVSSGSNASASVGLYAFAAVDRESYWELSLDASNSTYGYAHADATIRFADEITIDRDPVLGPTVRNELPTPILLVFNAACDQQLAWRRGQRTLPATVSTFREPDKYRCSLITVGPEPEVVAVTANTTAQADGPVSTTPRLGASYRLFDWALWVLPVDAESARVWRLSLGSAVVFSPDSELYATPVGYSAELSVEKQAETVWGPGLAFRVDDGVNRLYFTPPTPGLYVVRCTVTSAGDNSAAATNAAVFVAGSRN